LHQKPILPRFHVPCSVLAFYVLARNGVT